MSVDPGKFKFIDLFAGIGGMRIGFESAGGVCVLTSEIDDKAMKTYMLNFDPAHKHAYFGDIKKIPDNAIPKHDVLIAGFPCQPYSIAGLRKGLKDERGEIFIEIIRILKTSKPKAFLLENVKGILAHDSGATFNYLIEILEKAGYKTKWDILNSMTHANVPQNRERVFIVGFRDEKKISNFNFPKQIPLTKSISDCLESGKIDQKYYYDERFDCYTAISKDVRSKDTIYQWRRQYVRENKNNVCPTLPANMGSGGHNVPLIKTDLGIRKLTPRECGNFQGFPKSFKFPPLADSSLYHQFGNSVTVPLISKIAKEFAKVL